MNPFADTQILCYLLLCQFFSSTFLHTMFVFDVLSWKDSFSLRNFVQIVLTNVVLSFLFPVYILMKTRRYLPRLWNDDSPIILQNNDFFAVRLSQVNVNTSISTWKSNQWNSILKRNHSIDLKIISWPNCLCIIMCHLFIE